MLIYPKAKLLAALYRTLFHLLAFGWDNRASLSRKGDRCGCSDFVRKNDK
jgi:hypothetical protein